MRVHNLREREDFEELKIDDDAVWGAKAGHTP